MSPWLMAVCGDKAKPPSPKKKFVVVVFLGRGEGEPALAKLDDVKNRLFLAARPQFKKARLPMAAF